MVGDGKVVNAACTREVALKHMTGGGSVDEFINGNIEANAERTIWCFCRLFFLAEFDGSVVIYVEIGVDNMNGCVVF